MVDSELLPNLAGSRPPNFRKTVHPLRPLSRPEIDLRKMTNKVWIFLVDEPVSKILNFVLRRPKLDATLMKPNMDARTVTHLLKHQKRL